MMAKFKKMILILADKYRNWQITSPCNFLYILIWVKVIPSLEKVILKAKENTHEIACVQKDDAEAIIHYGQELELSLSPAIIHRRIPRC